MTTRTQITVVINGETPNQVAGQLMDLARDLGMGRLSTDGVFAGVGYRGNYSVEQVVSTDERDLPVIFIPQQVERREDMSPDGRLKLFLQTDGDVVIAVYGRDVGGETERASVEFCNVGSGGGTSPRTLEALKALMAAIDADNRAEAVSRFALRDYQRTAYYQVKPE